MRVQLRDDHGAAALIVALCTVLLIGLAAFAADFGLAYTSKRQLQTAADAASLAAAGQYAQVQGACTDLVNDTTARAAATSAADDMREDNRPDSQGTPLDIRCSADGRRLEVGYTASGSTPFFFGAVFGASGDLTTSRTATADVFVPKGVSGLRPYAICSSDLVPLPDTTWHKIKYPRPGCDKPSGDWYQLNCPEVLKGNGSRVLAEKTTDGCSGTVNIVPGQPASDPALTTWLQAACIGGPDDDCLGADPGANFRDSKVLKAWKTLVGESITLPVFRANSVIDPNGNNAKFPVYRLVGVTVCGYHWGPKGSHSEGETKDLDWADTQQGACSGADASSDTDKNYLLLNFIQVQVSGSSRPSDCGLAGVCDGGLREVRLIE